MPILRPDRRLEILHPDMRQKVELVVVSLRAEQIPLRVFETSRLPVRQAQLYQRGRDENGKRIANRGVVTHSKAWRSRHCFGFALDFAGWDGLRWRWPPAGDGIWKKLYEIADRHGLEPVKFEAPHLQLKNQSLEQILAGDMTTGSDAWENWIESAAAQERPDSVPKWAWEEPPEWLSGDRPELDESVS